MAMHLETNSIYRELLHDTMTEKMRYKIMWPEIKDWTQRSVDDLLVSTQDRTQRRMNRLKHPFLHPATVSVNGLTMMDDVQLLSS